MRGGAEQGVRQRRTPPLPRTALSLLCRSCLLPRHVPFVEQGWRRQVQGVRRQQLARPAGSGVWVAGGEAVLLRSLGRTQWLCTEKKGERHTQLVHRYTRTGTASLLETKQPFQAKYLQSMQRLPLINAKQNLIALEETLATVRISEPV